MAAAVTIAVTTAVVDMEAEVAVMDIREVTTTEEALEAVVSVSPKFI